MPLERLDDDHRVASDAFDAEVGIDEAGCVVVIKEALDHVGRSA